MSLWYGALLLAVFGVIIYVSTNDSGSLIGRPKGQLPAAKRPDDVMEVPLPLKERVNACQMLGDGKAKSTCCASMCMNDMRSPYTVEQCMQACHNGRPIKSPADVAFRPVITNVQGRL